jgi:hypothetical protein
MSRRAQAVLFGASSAVATLLGWARPPAGSPSSGAVAALLIGAATTGLAWWAIRRDERGAP